MAGLAAVLIRLLRIVIREMRSFNAIGGNNIFLVLFLFAQGGGHAAVFPMLVLAVLMLLPMSAHPLRRIPPERLELWPLTRRQRLAMQVLGIWLSPAAWIVAGLIAYSRYRTVGLILLAILAGAQILSEFMSRLTVRLPALNPFYDLPGIPGPLGELVRKDMRQLLSYLDPYVALVLCAGGVIYRFSAPNADREVFTVVPLLAVVIMGTSAQCLFGLEGPGGFTRYQLLPLRGWQVLGAKGIAWLAVVGVMVVPLSGLVGLSAAFVALGIGNHRSVQKPLPQTRWRFTGGDLIMLGVIQTMLSVSAGIAVARDSKWWAIPCVLFYLGSLWYYGRQWERAES